MPHKGVMPQFSPRGRIIGPDTISPGRNHLPLPFDVNHEGSRIRMLPFTGGFPADLSRNGIQANHKLRRIHPVSLNRVEEWPRETVTRNDEDIIHQFRRRTRAMVVVIRNDPLPKHRATVIETGSPESAKVHVHPIGCDNRRRSGLTRFRKPLRPRIDRKQFRCQEPQLARFGIKTNRPQRSPRLGCGGQPEGIPRNDRRRPPFARKRDPPGDVFSVCPSGRWISLITVSLTTRSPKLPPGNDLRFSFRSFSRLPPPHAPQSQRGSRQAQNPVPPRPPKSWRALRMRTGVWKDRHQIQLTSAANMEHRNTRPPPGRLEGGGIPENRDPTQGGSHANVFKITAISAIATFCRQR